MSAGEQRQRSEALHDKRARREELKKKWLEKRAAESSQSRQEESTLAKAVDGALTPLYVAVGAALILYRKITGRETVTPEDFE